jgi:molecular chaperone GrpE
MMKKAKDHQHTQAMPESNAEKANPDGPTRAHAEENKQVADQKTAGTEHAPRAAKAADHPAESNAKHLQDQLLRLRADFDNFRKRTLRDRDLVCETANQDLMTELLPVLDHLQLARKAASEHKSDPAFQEGLQLILDQLIGALSKFGLAPIEAEGKAFDPGLHEAINYLPSDEHPEGMVIAETRRGYLLNNRLLRAAQVVVSSGPPDAQSNNQNRHIDPET